MTARKLAAVRQKQVREQARYPLLSEQIAADQPPIDVAAEERIRQEHVAASELSMRNLHAKFWRAARHRYFVASADVRSRIQDEWRRWPGPLEATYFSYVVDKHTGELARRQEVMLARQREMAARVRADFARQQALFS
jgi:hypothetical protein